MAKALPDVSCHRCGQTMEAGYTTAIGLMGQTPPRGEPRLVFVVPGEPTSRNPMHALQQGLEGTPANRAYLLRGYRCPACGAVELMARDEASWTP